MVLFPKAAGQPLDAIIELTEVAVRISAMITAFCAAALCLIGPILVRILYGRSFAGAIGALRILAG